MFNVECIVILSILKATLHIDAISKALVFVKLQYVFIIRRNFNYEFQYKSFTNSNTPCQNKHIGVFGYNYFLCITSSNINLCSSSNYLSKLWYSNSSTIMEYDDFVKISPSRNYDFGLIHYMIE